MKEFLKYLLQLFVDHKEEIEIEERSMGENSFQYIITANSEDYGKIIGKGGKIIQSVRNIAKILAIKENKQIRIEIGE